MFILYDNILFWFMTHDWIILFVEVEIGCVETTFWELESPSRLENQVTPKSSICLHFSKQICYWVRWVSSCHYCGVVNETYDCYFQRYTATWGFEHHSCRFAVVSLEWFT